MQRLQPFRHWEPRDFMPSRRTCRCRQRSALERRRAHAETPAGLVKLHWPREQGRCSGDAGSVAQAGGQAAAAQLPKGRTRGTRYAGVCVSTYQTGTQIFFLRSVTEEEAGS